MPGRDIIVVGAWAGGMEALQALVRGLPPDIPAALFVVWHMPAHGLGVLPDVLARAGPLPAAHARDGEPIEPGRIYVAPPDRHLVTESGQIRLTRGPRVNHFRPGYAHERGCLAERSAQRTDRPHRSMCVRMA